MFLKSTITISFLALIFCAHAEADQKCTRFGDMEKCALNSSCSNASYSPSFSEGPFSLHTLIRAEVQNCLGKNFALSCERGRQLRAGALNKTEPTSAQAYFLTPNSKSRDTQFGCLKTDRSGNLFLVYGKKTTNEMCANKSTRNNIFACNASARVRSCLAAIRNSRISGKVCGQLGNLGSGLDPSTPKNPNPPENPEKPGNPSLGNPGNHKNVGRAGEKEGNGMNSPDGSRGKSGGTSGGTTKGGGNGKSSKGSDSKGKNN